MFGGMNDEGQGSTNGLGSMFSTTTDLGGADGDMDPVLLFFFLLK